MTAKHVTMNSVRLYMNKNCLFSKENRYRIAIDVSNLRHACTSIFSSCLVCVCVRACMRVCVC